MKKIPLTKGYVALVDDADFDLVNQLSWCAIKDPIKRTAYAQARLPSGRRVSMHRWLLGARESDVIDHQNHNGLDNRRSNLRFCTSLQNCVNRQKQAGAASRFKGVTWHRQTAKWVARITVNKRLCALGYFGKETDAAHAYDAAARQHFGEFAALNFPQPGERAA